GREPGAGPAAGSSEGAAVAGRRPGGGATRGGGGGGGGRLPGPSRRRPGERGRRSPATKGQEKKKRAGRAEGGWAGRGRGGGGGRRASPLHAERRRGPRPRRPRSWVSSRVGRARGGRAAAPRRQGDFELTPAWSNVAISPGIRAAAATSG